MYMSPMSTFNSLTMPEMLLYSVKYVVSPKRAQPSEVLFFLFLTTTVIIIVCTTKYDIKIILQGEKKSTLLSPIQFNSTIICVQRHRKDTEFLQRLEMQWGAASHHSSVHTEEVEKYCHCIYGIKKHISSLKLKKESNKKQNFTLARAAIPEAGSGWPMLDLVEPISRGSRCD